MEYVVGIDLGTTNSAVAYSKVEGDGGIRFLPIPQLVAPGQILERPVLPSFTYLPGEYELPEGATALPWASERSWLVGELAREQGASVPGRLVSSAKSWLCHGGVDRTAPILPWGAGEEVGKVSPVEASARYIGHIREAWNSLMARGDEELFLESQLVALTVPASFDEVARELTVRAARDAGLGKVVLLEEPLAAFYAWLSRHESDWRERMEAGQIILVCDVGGGTTDFTIIAVRQGEQGLKFDRLAVGDHLMLGGDNMDLTLARYVEQKLGKKPGQLEAGKWHQLVHKCRKAKEILLAEGREKEMVRLSLVGSGSGLIAGTLRARLEWAEVEEKILDGFFAAVSVADAAKPPRRRGLTEWGLPYVQDPSITRHLATFWTRFRDLLTQETGRQELSPDWVLFNGGALTPKSVRRRLQEVIRSWFPAAKKEVARELSNPRPELAVAIGAAYYGQVRLGAGVRVGAGTPRAYYVEVAPPKADDELQAGTAVCLVPRSAEEGTESRLEKPFFQVRTNQPVLFKMLSSSTRLGDKLGQILQLPASEVTPLPPIRTLLRFGKKSSARELPVTLFVKLTEVGTLELWCESRETSHRWRLLFDVRQPEAAGSDKPESAGTTVDAALIEQARLRVQGVFSKPASSKGEVERLVRELESVLALRRPRWPTGLIRQLADTLFQQTEGPGLSPHHEARWLNLLGFCLRPGFGDPLDEWRIKQAWKLFLHGLKHPSDTPCWIQWWIFWRRCAGGLSTGQQEQISHKVIPSLKPGQSGKVKGGKKKGRRFNQQEEIEAWMALANFERLSPATKQKLGRWLLPRIRKGKAAEQHIWALSRLGARVPFYGPMDRVVASAEVASWLDILLSPKIKATHALRHAVVHLARRTGDRARDLPAEARDRVRDWLARQPKGEELMKLLEDPGAALKGKERSWVYGESLPSGLVLAEG